MRKINLKAKNLSENTNEKSYSGQSSLVAGVIVMLVAGLLYGTVFYLKSAQDKKNLTISTSIQNLKSGLDNNDEYKKLYDFQDRLLEIEDISKNKVIQTNVLNQISEATINENTVKRLKIVLDKGKSEIEMTIQVADLNILAKQLESYSKIAINRQASLSSTSLKDDYMEAAIKFSVKNIGEDVNP